MKVRNLEGNMVELPLLEVLTVDNGGGRMTRIERRLMESEYLVDSTNIHVRKKGCDDVKPRALARYTKALNALRGAITMIRLETGVRHPTLFAGSANPSIETTRSQTQKTWGISPGPWMGEGLRRRRAGAVMADPVGYQCSWCRKEEHRACTKYAALDHPVPECMCPC